MVASLIESHGNARMPRLKRGNRAQTTAIENMILIAITLAIGGLVWSFANANASSLMASYNERAAADINQIKERFLIVHVSFNYPQPNKVTVWVYNSGATQTEIITVFFGTSENSLSQVSFSPSPSVLAKGQLSTLNFTSAVTSGTTYFVKVAGKFGNTAIIFQKA